ncbi:unnamed protein product [Adineta steineri]|uniref:Uncharacterized protein n=1 Tax=Adineta steineri TaxID=433720 RepID=A0A819NXJ6_9BILA|nr:unnamed protein product [Adineta steineri]CAF4006830.1 unnamed protein product [Adineta steineri]
MSSINLDDDDLIIFDSLDDDNNEYHSPAISKLSISDCQSIDYLSPIESNNKKMSDIIDLLNSTDFDDKQDNPELISTDIINSIRTHNLENDQDNYETYQWESEENYLKYGSKQLSPNDYLTRTSLYNRPVAFEKDSRVWARSLLDNFKKSKSTNFPYYFPTIKSSSFNHHVQYIEHLNECNDYPAYLEYLRENRSQLFYTLTDSIDIIDGLIGTAVSTF